MNLSRAFIERPVATALLTIGLALAGMVSYALLPVAPLPSVDMPVIFVSASMPGASPDVMATSVATPLERHLGTIAGVNEMTSSSSVGNARITLQFDLNRDIDGAARDVQAAINAARADLPASLRSNPTYRKINPADQPILILALTSDTLTPGQIYDSASTILQQKLSQVSGIGQVQISGSSLPAVRVDLNPRALFKYGIGLETVRAALSAANANAPKGAVEQGERRYQVYVNDQVRSADDFKPLIVAYRNDAAVRLQDVANVYEGVEDVRNLGMANGKPAILVILSRQPGANIIETAANVKAVLPELSASLPPAIQLRIVSDRTQSITSSLTDVQITMLIAICLVMMVVYLFLRNPRATVIPSVAVPLSLLGTFGVMYLAGYTLDVLSLMALTVATGFVVDDAIVVLENVTRHIEAGMPRFQAALRGTQEVGFTVLSMSLSLVAVFIPILFMGGVVGRFFQEFAVTLATAVGISLVISLTTTAMLCGHLDMRHGQTRYGPMLRTSERVFEWARRFYARSLRWALDNPLTILFIFFVTFGLNIFLYGQVPAGFLPAEDTGQIMGGIRADQAISFQLMQQKFATFIKIIHDDPAVDAVSGFTGGGGGGPRGGSVNSANVFIQLKPLPQRGGTSTDDVVRRLSDKLNSIAGARIFMRGAGNFRAGGRQSDSSYQYSLLGETLSDLDTWSPRILDALQNVPELEDVNSDRQDAGLEVQLQIDRATATRLGVTTSQITSTLYDAFGQRQVSTIYQDQNQYHVVMGVAPQFWQSPETLKEIYVSTSGGSLSGTQATGSVAGTTVTASGTTQLTAADVANDPRRNQSMNALTSTVGGAASTAASVSTRLEKMVPLSAFASYGPGTTPLSINHEGPFVSTTFSFNLAKGHTLGQAVDAINRTMAQLNVPVSIHGDFAGNARLFQQSNQNQLLLILAAIGAVFIILGILYESLVHPLTIISTLPSAGVGALIALLIARKFDETINLNLIALIGIILLIGIVKKNAIMMVDFALDAERTRGLTSRQAIYEACQLRFRPIMMTTFAAILGALPLAVGFGTGAEMRQPLGISIVGGLLVSQVLTLYTTPVIYLYMDSFRLWSRRRWARFYARLLGDPMPDAAE